MSAPAIYAMPDPASEPDRIAELEARVLALEIFMGMAPVHPDASPASPEPPLKRPRKPESALPQSDCAKLVAGIFHRKLTTPWSVKEIAAFKALGKLDSSDLLTLANYYESERAKGHREDGSAIGVHRHDLGTFLNNFRGELDRATVWAMRHPAAAKKPLAGSPAKTVDVEPEGFRAEFDAEYPEKAGLQWAKLPPEMRIKYR